MRTWLQLAGLTMGLASIVACEGSNPRSCLDGTCTDPAFPFCDTDGALGGNPGACISVDCTPNMFESCRGDVAVTCNAQGTTYDLIQCERGCGATGCNACADDSHCSNPTPLCETATHTCRGCKLDDECPSKVCDIDSGSCVAESLVVYASPTGTMSGQCTMGSPCELLTAIAAANATRSTIRLQSGTYTAIPKLSTGAITFVGPGATLRGGTAANQQVMSVGRGATVKIRGVHLDLSNGSLLCGGEGTSGPFMLGGTLVLRDLLVDATILNSTYLIGCNASARNVTFQLPADGNAEAAVSIGDDGTFDADQITVKSTTASMTSVSVNAHRATVRIFNSTFDHAALTFLSQDSGSAVSKLTLAFNTFVSPASAISAGGLATILLENNILFGSGTSVYNCAGCTASHNIMYPQAAVPAGNIPVDPQFVDTTGRDYHLKATSPARDAAVSSTGLSSDHDVEGVKRPQGAAPDIGAYELKP